jgi:hypothetical protein
LKVGRSAVDEGLRDQVRDRCARAALAVTEPGGHSGLLLRRGLRTDGVGEAGQAFGAALYEPDQTSGLPQEAVLPARSAAPARGGRAAGGWSGTWARVVG